MTMTMTTMTMTEMTAMTMILKFSAREIMSAMTMTMTRIITTGTTRG